MCEDLFILKGAPGLIQWGRAPVSLLYVLCSYQNWINKWITNWIIQLQKNSISEKILIQKSFSGWGFAPDPTGGAHDAPPDPLVGWLMTLKPGPPTFKIAPTPLITDCITECITECIIDFMTKCVTFSVSLNVSTNVSTNVSMNVSMNVILDISIDVSMNVSMDVSDGK